MAPYPKRQRLNHGWVYSGPPGLPPAPTYPHKTAYMRQAPRVVVKANRSAQTVRAQRARQGVAGRASYRPKGKVVKRSKKSRFSKYSRKYNSLKGIRRKCYYGGSTIKWEGGGLKTDAKCIVLGHGLPYHQLRRAFFLALLKSLFLKANMPSKAPDALVDNLQQNDIVAIYYRPTASGSTNPPTSVNHTVGAGGSSLSDMATDFMNKFMVAGIFGDAYQTFSFEKIALFPGGTQDSNFCQIWLNDVSVCFYFDSYMKIQNRTKGTADNDEADDLDNMPLTGKSYFGSGTRINMKFRNWQDADNTDIMVQQNSVIYPNPGTNKVWDEPLSPNALTGVKSSHRVSFQPGVVKLSKLKYQKCMGLNYFVNDVINNYDLATPLSPNTNKQTRIGKYRFFMLEKEIEIKYNEAIAQDVTLAYEIDVTCGVLLKIRNNKFLSRENFLNLDVTGS